MNHFESTYTAHDGAKLYLQAWMPENPKASILLVHGLGEHSGRYSSFASNLVEAGIAVFTFDGRGHGKSTENGATAYFESAEDYLKDIEALYGKAKNYISGKSAFILGHSMGGGMVAALLLRSKMEVSGVVLSSSAIMEADGTPKILMAVGNFLSKYFPKLKVLKLDIEGISRIPEEVKKYREDPLVYQENIPARTGAEVLALMKYVQGNAEKFSSPVLLIHGDADRLTNVKGSQLLYEKASSQDKTLKIFPGGYHELLNDLDREQVSELILNWILVRIPKD